MASDTVDRAAVDTAAYGQPPGETIRALADAAAPAARAPKLRARIRRRRRATGTIAVGFALLLGAILMQGGLVLHTQRLIFAMQASRAMQIAAANMLQSLLNAETGQRGFLLTSDEHDLDSYQEAAQALPAQIDALQHVKAHNPAVDALIARTVTMARQKMSALQQTVTLERAGRHDQALALVRSGQGKDAMNAVRASVAELQEGVEVPLARQRISLDSLQSWLMLGVLSAMVTACVLAGVLIRSSGRQLRALELREDTLRRLAAGLERRVAQRTSSLAEANLRFHAALRASGVTVFTQDMALRYSWTSKDIFGLPSDQFIGCTDDAVLPPGTSAALGPVKRGVLRTGDPARAEISIGERGARRWFDITIDAQRDADGAIVGIVCAAVEITEQKERESRIRLLMRELTHRSKNLLTVIDAIARQTAANSDGVKDFLTRFRDRLHSLAGSHDQLVHEDWQGAWLRELVLGQLGHYYDARSPAILLEGPRVRVQPEAAQHIGLALHELATNAAKYGALSTPDGRVRIAWDVEQNAAGDPVCRIGWTESGGPPVRPPARRGFGHVVIERTVARALGGSVALQFPRDGLRWTLTFPAELITTMATMPAG